MKVEFVFAKVLLKGLEFHYEIVLKDKRGLNVAQLNLVVIKLRLWSLSELGRQIP